MIGLAWLRHNVLRRPRPPQQLRRIPVCLDSIAGRDQLVHELANVVAREFDRRTSLPPEIFFVGFVAGSSTVACTRLRADVDDQVVVSGDISGVLVEAIKVHLDGILAENDNAGGAA